MDARAAMRAGSAELEYAPIGGDPSKPTLVFLHEGLGSISTWRDVPSSLCARTGFPGLVYSRYGNGSSPVLTSARTPRYMHDEAMQALPQLLDALHVGRVVLFGHSDGASIALLFAAEHPDRVGGLVLEAPHVFVEDVSVRSIAAIRSHYRAGGLRERLARHHADPDATFYGWNDVWLSPEFSNWNIESAVDRVRCPILAVQGRDDEYGTLAQIETIARRHAGTDSVVLANCGHAPHRDRRDFVEASAAGWIVERASTARVS